MILVTGGTGLVGAHLLYYLTLENDAVRAIYRSNSNLKAVEEVFGYYNSPTDLFQKIEWVKADITDIVDLEIAFEGITQVYHAAALVSFKPSDFKLLLKTNIEGTANVVNLCIANSVKKLCYVSSIATIDKSVNKKPITEENEWNIERNNSGYAISKNGAEMEVWRASQEGVPVVIVNPGIILGAGFWQSGSGSIFSKIKKGLHFYTEGVTGYVGVTDVVKIMMLLMQSSIQNERFILVAENVSFKWIFDTIADGFKVKKPTVKVTKLMSEIGWRVASVISLFSNKQPIITKHSAKSIHHKKNYSSKKIIETLQYIFEPISTVISKTCEAYKNQ